MIIGSYNNEDIFINLYKCMARGAYLKRDRQYSNMLWYTCVGQKVCEAAILCRGHGEPRGDGADGTDNGARHHSCSRQPLPEHAEDDGHHGRTDQDAHEEVYPAKA